MPTAQKYDQRLLTGDHTNETIDATLGNIVLDPKSHKRPWMVMVGIGFVFVNIMLISITVLVFTGIGLGALYKIGYNLLKGWSESVNYDFQKFLKGGTVGIDATPALLGVGYIIGPKIAALMLSGAVLG